MSKFESLKGAVIKEITIDKEYESCDEEICVKAIELEDGRVIVLSGSYQVDVNGVWMSIQ